MSKRITQKAAIPLSPPELDVYCNEHAEIGTYGGTIGFTSFVKIWYLAKRDGKYLKVSADNLEEDKHPGETVELKNGEEFYLGKQLRKLKL